MKKVIKGRVYDTDKAKLIGEISFGSYGDATYEAEELYVNKAGAYFLYGHGGALSKFGKAIAVGSISGSSLIKPLTLEEAKEWTEENLDGDTYEETFGEIEETEERSPLKINLSSSCIRKLELLRSETGKSISQLIEEKFM